MKHTDAQCRINAVSIIKLEVEPTSPSGELAMSATTALLNKDEGGMSSHARSKYNGPWPEHVAELLKELHESVEGHLLTVHFEVDDDGRTTGRGSAPRGIIATSQPGLGGSEDPTPQL